MFRKGSSVFLFCFHGYGVKRKIYIEKIIAKGSLAKFLNESHCNYEQNDFEKSGKKKLWTNSIKSDF